MRRTVRQRQAPQRSVVRCQNKVKIMCTQYIFSCFPPFPMSIFTLALVPRSFGPEAEMRKHIHCEHRVCVICIQYLYIYFYWISSEIFGRCVNVCVRLLSIVASVPVVLLFLVACIRLHCSWHSQIFRQKIDNISLHILSGS